MGIIEFLANITLALGALIIAILQWREELRAIKAEKQEEAAREHEKATMQTIVTEILEVEECTKCISVLTSTLSQYSMHGNANPIEVLQLFDAMTDNYTAEFEEISPVLTELYDLLLQNEEKFPMSHGYGRYISELKEILDFDAVLRERRRNGYDTARYDMQNILIDLINKGGDIPMEVRMILGQKVEDMVQALEPYYVHSRKIHDILFELKCKYARKHL